MNPHFWPSLTGICSLEGLYIVVPPLIKVRSSKDLLACSYGKQEIFHLNNVGFLLPVIRFNNSQMGVVEGPLSELS